MLSFSFRELQFIIVSLLICAFYKLKHKVRLSKTACEIFHFRFGFVFIRAYIFVQHKMQGLFEFKTS